MNSMVGTSASAESKHEVSGINNPEAAVLKNTRSKEKILNISDDIIASILDGLQSFEKTKQFLSLKVTLNSLAKDLNTNSNYLSKVVNHHKKTSFANYINSLRIDYFINLVKKDSTLRKYTIKAIATEVGFSNAESFSKAFVKHKGIRPSYFLKELEKSLKT